MPTFPKSLIIGLGGLGSDVVVDIYKRFNGHIAHEEDKKKVRFLVLDTDANEINARRQIMNPEDVIQTSATSNITVGNFIDEIKTTSSVRNWFLTESSQLNQMTINDGAGQIRSVSRLAFSHAIYSNKLDRFEIVIDEMLSLQTGEGNNIEIHIVSSLAGGTGAGSFLQTAYFVKELLAKRGIHQPKIWGYFMLADIFLRDSSINLSDKTKTTNVLANTYACIKELNGIYEMSDGLDIEFEYGNFSKEGVFINKNNSIPFTQCFLYDFENNSGGNLRKIDNYKKQMEEFIYLNAFSPTGAATRSQAINNIFEQLLEGSSARFGSSGISKVVYPIDNIIQYFASRRLYDNLQTTWLKIDNDFRALHNEWKKNSNKGIIAKEPILSEFFINNVETLAANGRGAEQAIFGNILRSTKVIDNESKKEIGDKSDVLIMEVLNYLTNLRDNDNDISVLSKVYYNDNFTAKNSDESNDRSQIKRIEDQLETLYSEVLSFVDDNKRLASEEIFTKDFNSFGYVDEQAKHRVNSYLLEKDKALHPLAMRFFFYQLLGKLNDIVSDLKQRNERSFTSINKYKEVFDIKDEKGGEDTRIETALEAYNVYLGENKFILNVWSKVTGKSSKLGDFKEDYVTKSKRQARVLNEFALERLQEFVLEELIFQIKKVIANLESLFKVIPGVLTSLENEQNALIANTSEESGNPSNIYVLSDINHRNEIYNNEVSVEDSIYFPEDISRNIYEEIYTRSYQQITNPIAYTLRNNGDERIHHIFTDMVIQKQKKQLKEIFIDSFAGYNVIQAMKKQAELEGEDALDFMSSVMRDAEQRATPFGARYEPGSSKINSWAVHPECLENQYVTNAEADRLFDNQGNAQNNAKRVVSTYFDKTEIIREDSVMVLSVPEHYPKFAPIDETKSYSTSQEGIYFTYYKKRIKEIQNSDILPSPHLDKRWNNPKFFRNLGVNADSIEKDIIKAFIYGLANKDILVTSNYGSAIWGYQTNTGIKFLQDDQGKNVKLDIRKLLLECLWNNESLMEQINLKLLKETATSIEIWRSIRGGASSISTLPLIDKIKKFSFVGTDMLNGKNLISIFTGYIVDAESDSRYLNLVLDILIESIIAIAENNGNDTRKFAESIISPMIESIQEDSIPLNKQLVSVFLNNKLEHYFN
jgi:hypothetical protein